MNLNIKFGSKNSNPMNAKKIISSLAYVWQKAHIALFFTVLFALIIFGGYIWQQSLYGPGWSEERRQEFLNSQDKGVIFKEKDFQKVISDIQTRKIQSAQEYKQLKDIFKAY